MRLASLALALAQSASAPAAPSLDARHAFERAAAAIEHVDYGDVLYGRVGWRRHAPDGGAAALTSLFARRDAAESLAPLLRHDSPRVRTLALLAMFDREDPAALPRLRELADDGAETFPAPLPDSALPVANPPRLEAFTVRRVARLLVDFYLQHAGLGRGIEGLEDVPGFDGYWSERSGRASCASWFAVRLARGNPLALRSGDLSRTRAVRADVDRLPPDDRAMTLLWLDPMEGAFATGADRLAAARSLGRDKLLAILRREPPTADPDLKRLGSRQGSICPYARMAATILENARELLAPEDSARLLELERDDAKRSRDGREESLRMPQWTIGAASLDPARAREILAAGYETFSKPYDAHDRGTLLAGWWRCMGPRAAGDLVDRFYAEPLEADRDSPGRLVLIRSLGEAGSAADRALLAAIVRHASFADVDPVTLVEVARTVGRWTDAPVISEDEIRGLSHPLGVARMKSPEARERHPGHTRQMLELTQAWAARIAASAPRWTAPEARPR